MAHSLILGMTESGKTTLAKALAKNYQQEGIKVLVLDPLSDPDWGADFQTSNQDEFLEVYWNSKRCMAFIDEAGESVGRYNKVMEKTATRGRHWGHSNHYISQRGTQIAATIRDQCSNLFLFTSSLKDCKIHSEEWNKKELLNGSSLKQGEFYHATRYGLISKGKMF